MHRVKVSISVLDRLWLSLRSPETLAFLLIILTFNLLLSLLIPQAPPNLETPEAQRQWLADLSPGKRSLAERAMPLALHRVSSTAWFWLPAAGLILSSLVAAADCLNPICGRLWPDARRREISGRLFLSRQVRRVGRIYRKPEDYLPHLEEKLATAGYQCWSSSPADRKSLVAVRHRWSWLAPLLVYGGLILILVGLAVNTWLGASETITLQPQATDATVVAGRGTFLHQVDFRLDSTGQVVGGTAQVAFKSGEFAPRASWPLHRPLFQAGWLLWVVDVQPLVQVSVKDIRGEAQYLFPDQSAAKPGTTLRLSLDDNTRSALFFGAQRQWAMEVIHRGYLAAPNEQFSVRLFRFGQDEPAPPVLADANGVFQVDQLSGHVDLEHGVRVFASKIWNHVLIFLGGVSLLLGMVALALAPPSLLSVSLNVKGFGGQATAQGETLGSVTALAETLANLLADAEAVQDDD